MTRQNVSAAIAIALLLRISPATAGHGMVTSFAAIEWLPEPGRTPDQLLYFLDGWTESRELDATRSPQETVDVSLRIAREKLAELEAMVRAGNGAAAQTAAARYRALLARAAAAAGTAPMADGVAESVARTLCQALLEHRYILSVDYETLPPASRAILVDVEAQAHAAYRDAAARLARKDRDPFQFKENEVRWSVRAGMAPN